MPFRWTTIDQYTNLSNESGTGRRQYNLVLENLKNYVKIRKNEIDD